MSNPELTDALSALDKIINKARVHFYKPIQIAEILFHHRIYGAIDLKDKETYRNISKKWRDDISNRFLGANSTSSSIYQDNLFNENALPPHLLFILGEFNASNQGVVEAYIYKRFKERFSQIDKAITYCSGHNRSQFDLKIFLNYFLYEKGLKRSIDKVYEIIVFALFSTIVEYLEVNIEISINPDKADIFSEFKDFAAKVINLKDYELSVRRKAQIYRVGVTNAADRGLDMWANFGLVIQVKHLSLDEELAEDVIHSISADRVVIVCKEAEQKTIISLLNQIGWRARIQSIITEKDLYDWYGKALKGKYGSIMGDVLIQTIITEINAEFPITNTVDFDNFYSQERNYHLAKPIA